MGSRYLEAKPVNASFGSMDRCSGLVYVIMVSTSRYVLRDLCRSVEQRRRASMSLPTKLHAPMWTNRRPSPCGRRVRVEKLTSGPVLSARTVSLCSHSLAGAVKSTHRMGTLTLFASVIHTFLVSGSAFVLSKFVPPLVCVCNTICGDTRSYPRPHSCPPRRVQ